MVTVAQLRDKHSLCRAYDTDQLRSFLAQALRPPETVNEIALLEQFSARMREALQSWS